MIRIRRTTNVELIDSLQRTCLPYDTPLPYKSRDWWWVAEDTETDEAVGIACLKETGSYGYLARAGVVPSHRGQGLQKKLIRVREYQARKAGLTHIISDTSHANIASANSLIGTGFKLYTPIRKWAFADGHYWIKSLLPAESAKGRS